MPSDLDTPRFTVSEAARAAGDMPVNTLRSWLHHGKISLGREDAAAPPGGTRLLSLRRVLQVAITYELVRIHQLPPASAAVIAADFTDISEGALPDSGMMDRDPGRVFGDGAFTWLVFHNHLAGMNGRVLRITPETLATQLAFALGTSGMLPGAWLPLDPIVNAVEHFAERHSQLS